MLGTAFTSNDDLRNGQLVCPYYKKILSIRDLRFNFMFKKVINTSQTGTTETCQVSPTVSFHAKASNRTAFLRGLPSHTCVPWSGRAPLKPS